MAFHEHYKLTFSGIFGNPASPYEAWAFGYAIGFDDPILPPADSWADDQVSVVQTYLASVSAPAAKLTQVKIAVIHSDGLYDGVAPAISAVVPAAGDAAIKYPPQISLVVSTQSASIARSGRGRWYIPAPADELDVNTGLAVDTDVAATLAASKTFLNDSVSAFETSGSFGLGLIHPVIASRKGLGTNFTITELRVGHVLDTMRSRRRSMAEAYDVVAL